MYYCVVLGHADLISAVRNKTILHIIFYQQNPTAESFLVWSWKQKCWFSILVTIPEQSISTAKGHTHYCGLVCRPHA